MSNQVILVTAGYDHKIRFWDAPSTDCKRTLRFEHSQVNALCISPNKRYLCAAGNPFVRVWDIERGTPTVVNFEGHAGNVVSAGFNATATWLYTGSEDGTIKMWDLRSPVAQRTYQNKSPVNAVTLHPNEVDVISGDQAGTVRVWNLAGAEMTSVLELVPDGDVAIRSVTMASDASKFVAGNNNADIFVWEPVSSVEYKPQHSFNAHKQYLLKAVFSPDTRLLVSTSADRTACVWSTETWEREKTLAVHQRWVWDAAFSADSNYLVTASSDQSARLWDLHSGGVIKHYTGHNLAVTCVALNDTST